MATVEELLGPRPKTVEELLGPRPTGSGIEPPPFDTEGFLTSVGKERGFALDATERDGFARTIAHFSRPFVSQFYEINSSANRGMASFYEGLDLVADFISNRTGAEKGGLFSKLSKTALENADYWKKRADEVGVNFIDELVGSALGGFAPGVAGFALDVGSLYTLPAMRGFARAEKTGDNPFVSGLVEAAQTKSLHMMFKAMDPLKKYLKAPMMGTIFGTQEAAVAPEGEGGKAFAKGFGTGVGYSIFSPGGQMGLGEMIKNARIQKALKPEAVIPESEVLKNDPIVEKIIQEKERFVEETPKIPIAEPGKEGERLIRIQEKGDETIPSADKPQGLYLSFEASGSPHRDLGGKEYVYEATAQNPLDVSEPLKVKHIERYGLSKGDPVEASAGIKALKKLVPDKEFERLLKLTKKEAIEEFSQKYPEVDWSRYYDSYEMLEAVAGIEARKAGYDAIVSKEKALPEFSEYVALSPSAIREPGAAKGDFTEIVPDRPLADQFAPVGGPKESPRKFWKTVEEADRTAPEAKEIMGEIQKEEPVVNIVQPNRTNLEKAYSVLEKKGFDDTLKMAESGEGLSPVEKGALFNVLMERAQKDGDWGKFVSIMDTYSLYLADLGRGVQIASVWGRSTPMGFIKWAEKQLEAVNKKYGWADTLLGRKKAALTEQEKIQMAQEFTRIQKLPDGPEKSNEMLKLIDRVAVKVPPSISEMIDAYRYQNMLSGPQTQERNIFWNMTNTFITRPMDLAGAGVIDFFGSALRGTERKAYISDVPTYMKEALGAIPTALTAFKAAWKQELGEIMQKPDLGVDYKTPFEQARTKQLPKALTVVQRFMEAQDKFNSILITAGEKARMVKNGVGEIEATAKAKALAEKYLVRDKLDPNDPSLSLFSKAVEGLGVTVEHGRHLPVIGKPLGWVVPFLRTPIKVGVTMIERSPLGWARGNIDVDSASKLVGGAMVTGLGAMFAYMGEVTWSAPTNEEEKQWFFASGRRPYSFKVGETWVPAWYLGPFALAFMFPAAVKHYTQDSKQSMTNDDLEKLSDVAGGIAKFVASQTSAQSIGNFFAFMSGDIDYNVKNQVGFTIGQFIPLGAMLRYVNKAIDPVYRKAEGVLEQTQKNIPVWSEELPARTKPFMEESRRDFFNLFLPYEVGVEDPAYETLYPMKKIEARQKYLDNKMNQLIQKMGEGDYREKHFDEMIKIMNAAPKVFE